MSRAGHTTMLKEDIGVMDAILKDNKMQPQQGEAANHTRGSGEGESNGKRGRVLKA